MADLSITAANVAKGSSGIPKVGTAGATITAGQTIYLDSATGKMKLSQNTSATLADVKGVSLNGASDEQPVSYLEEGDIDLGVTLTVGEIYVLSATAGGIAPEADNGSGEFVTILGVASAADNLKLKINASGVAVP